MRKRREFDPLSMKCDPAMEFLAELVERLDELDESDFFGTEGWRKFLMGE